MTFDKAALAWSLTWDADGVTAVAFIGNRRVAAGNNLGQLLVWDLPEKPGDPAPPVRRLDGHTNVVTRLAATRDGRQVISASNDHTIRVWDMAEPGRGETTIVLNARAIADAEARKRNGAKVPLPVTAKVSVQTTALVLDHHKDWVTAMSLSHDESLIVSGDDGGHVVLWDRAAGRVRRHWTVTGWVHALALSPDHRQALVGERVPLIFDSGRHAGLKLWDVDRGTVERDLATGFKGMHLAAAAYAPDGKTLAVGRGGEVDSNAGKVWLLDPATGKTIRELTPGHLNGLTDLAFHPSGGVLASSGRDTLVRLWNVADGTMLKELGKPRGGQFKDWIHAVSFSPDGTRLAAADMAGAVQVWSLSYTPRGQE